MGSAETAILMTGTCIVHYEGATAQSLSVVASIAADLRTENQRVSVIDLLPTTVIRQGLPSNFLARILGHKVRPGGFAVELNKLGVKYSMLRVSGITSEISEAELGEINAAVDSELFTYFRLDHIPKTSEAKSLRAKLFLSATRTFWSLKTLWTADKPAEILVPNGRTSRQKAARLVAESLGIPVRLYESGRAREKSYYLGTTQPHDRIASQSEVDQLTSSLSDSEIETLADEWLASRMRGDGGTNSFSYKWRSFERESKKDSDKKRAVFFASSFDEFLAFGPMWNIDEWSTRFEAFEMTMLHFSEQDVELTLRLHPNLATKSRKYFLREVADILSLQKKFPNLKIHWHNSSANSYQIVANADYVIVERSTIGLESSLLGKPVWVTQASQWDKIADVRSILSPAEANSSALSPWTVSRRGAQKFVAYWMIQERPLRYGPKDWASWDPEKASPAIKILQLTLRNTLRHKIRLVALELSRIRNNIFSPPPDGPRER